MNNKEQEHLLKKYEGFTHFMVQKFQKNLKIYDYDDLLQEFRMVLLEAWEKHDETQGKFLTFAGLLMKHKFLYLLREQKAEKRPDYLLTLDKEVVENEDVSFVDIAVSLYEQEKTPHELYKERLLTRQILEELEKMDRGFITKEMIYEEISVQDLAVKYNVSESLIKLTNKHNLLRLKTIFKDLVIENQGEDTFSLEEFNDTYEKGFFDGK
jgi:DNA-directed RNA polymerase specialized sigma subunit